MEQKLILFAKMHGYIIASIMMCSGIALTISFAELGIFPLRIGIVLWSVNPILLVYGCIKEDATWLKPAKCLCVIFSIIGFLLLLMGASGHHIIPMGPLWAIFAVSLYGIYVVDFLEKLFTHLQKLRPATITITTIVCEVPPTVPLQNVQPDETTQQQPSPQPEAAVATNATPSAPQTKEFPTWT